jgi:hypothetical protein
MVLTMREKRSLTRETAVRFLFLNMLDLKKEEISMKIYEKEHT